MTSVVRGSGRAFLYLILSYLIELFVRSLPRLLWPRGHLRTPFCAQQHRIPSALAAAMVYGGASHLSASDVEREQSARQGALSHQVEREKSARLGAPTREEVDAWELLQRDNRNDHIGPRVPDGRLPSPAPDSSSDCCLLPSNHHLRPSVAGRWWVLTFSSARLQIAPSFWPKASCAAIPLRTTPCAGPLVGSHSSSYQACTWRCATRHAPGSLQRRPVKERCPTRATARQLSPVRLAPQ